MMQFWYSGDVVAVGVAADAPAPALVPAPVPVPVLASAPVFSALAFFDVAAASKISIKVGTPVHSRCGLAGVIFNNRDTWYEALRQEL